MEEAASLSPSTTRDRRNRTCRTLDRHRFENEELEALFYRYDAKIRKSWVSCLLILLAVLGAVLSVVGFVYYRSPTAQSIFLVTQCGICLCLLIFVHTKWLTESTLLAVSWVIFALCLIFAVVSLPVSFGDRPGVSLSTADGVWEITLLVFLVYAFLPFKFYIALGTGIFLPVVHIIVSVLMANGFTELLWRQLSSNAMIFVAVNCAGTYIHDRGEYIRRKCFLDTRNCISARLQVDEERNKLEQLLLNILPPYIALEMKRDLTRQREGILQKHYIQQHDEVSVLFADVTSISSVHAQSKPEDSVKFLNELFARFDQLAKERHCLRVKLLGDCYVAVSGMPEPRPDQAKCCVDLALDMVDTLLAIQDTSEVHIGMRIGVHTGRVVAGLLGQKRWQFDIWSDTVETARQLELAGEPGKVLISQATLEHLHGEFDVEMAASVLENSAYLRQRGMEVYFIQSTHPRRQTSFVRNKAGSGRFATQGLNDMGCRLIQSIRCSAEMPFTHALPACTDDRQPAVNNHVDYDSSKNPFIKRSLTGRCEDRINRHLEMAIATRSIDRDKDSEMNLCTLCFRKASRERRYHSSDDASFSGSIVASLLILLCLATVQALILPRTVLLLILFLVTFSWISFILILLLGTKLKCVTCELMRSPVIRISIIVLTTLLVYSVAQVNVFSCVSASDVRLSSASISPMSAFSRGSHLVCYMPQYIYLSCLVGFLVVAIYLKISTLIKLVLLVLMATGYVVLIMYWQPGLFHDLDFTHNYKIPSSVLGVIVIAHFLLTIYVHGRQMEWIYRLDFLWRTQCTEERIELTELQNHSRQLLCNALPTHIVPRFIDMGQKKCMELYSQLYPQLGVVFINIPDLVNHYVQHDLAGRPLETVRALNEIISEFDELLNEEKFRGVEKIKSHGTQYMAAVGLAPERTIQEIEDSIRHHMSVLVEFTLAVRTKVHSVGENYGMQLSFRAGMNVGPAVAGVIGARRGQFDLYGETVNLACLLERSSKMGYIQVPDDVFRPLRYRYDFHCQGPMPVKGRGHMTTYLLLGKKPPGSPGSGPAMNRMFRDHWRRPPTEAMQQALQNNNVIRTSIHEPFDMANFRYQHPALGDKQPVPAHAAALGMNVAPIRPLIINPVNEQPLGKSRFPTPPGSMGSRRKTSSSDSKEERTGSGSLTKGMLAPLDQPLARIESPGPELPAVHFRNMYMQGGSLPGRIENPTKVLTQSQILHGTKRPGSRGSLSGVGELEQENRKNRRTPLSPSHFEKTPKIRSPSFEGQVLPPRSGRSPTAKSPTSPSNGTQERKKSRSTPQGPQRPLYSPHSNHTASPVSPSGRSYKSATPTSPAKHEPVKMESVACQASDEEMLEEESDVFEEGPVEDRMVNGEKEHSPSFKTQSPNQVMLPRRTQSARTTAPGLAGKPPLVVPAKGRSLSASTPQQPALPFTQHVQPYSQGGFHSHQPPELYPMKIRNSLLNRPLGINELKPTIDAQGGNWETQRALRLALLQRPLDENQEPLMKGRLQDIVPPRPAPPTRDASSTGWQLRPLQDVIAARQRGELTDSSSISTSERGSPEPSPPPLPPPPADYDGPRIPDVPADLRLDLDHDDIHIPEIESPSHVPYESAFKPLPQYKVAVTVPLCKTPETEEAPASKPPYSRPVKKASDIAKGHIESPGEPYRLGTHLQALVSPGAGARAQGKPPARGTRPAPPPYQVKRRPNHRTPIRKCRSLDYIPSDVDDGGSVPSSRGSSPPAVLTPGTQPDPFLALPRDMHKYLLPDNISLSSLSSEMSRSDPAVNYDSSTATCESEYDNYRPGMASDEDMFVPEVVSDMDIDMFDDIDFDKLTVSDKYSLDLPIMKKKEKITDV